MDPLFLPVLHSFENNNIFTGSFGALRFRVTPSIVMLNQKEVNFDESSMKCECWHGEYCYEKSQMEDEKVFPLSEPARQEKPRRAHRKRLDILHSLALRDERRAPDHGAQEKKNTALCLLAHGFAPLS